jgi:peptide/nickel transport system substrate-binding protein
MRRILFSILIILLFCTTSACDRSQSGDGESAALTPVSGGTAVIAFSAEPDVLNPLLYKSAMAGQILVLMYDGLVEMGEDFLYAPAIAERLEISPDKLGITVHLRDWNWSDGTPLTAADIVHTISLYQDPVIASPRSGSRLANIESVTAIDSRTLLYRFKTFRTDLIPTLGHFILPSTSTGDLDRSLVREWAMNEMPTACGMFQLEDWTHDRSLMLVRNAQYPAEKSRLERLIFRIIPDQTAQLIELETGGVDFVEDVPSHEAVRLGRNPELRVESYDSRYVGQVYWNHESDLFRDRRVRKALSLAIDREMFVTGLLNGYGSAAAGPLPPALWAHDPSIKPDAYSPEEARRLLTNAGWVDHDGDGVREKGGVDLDFVMLTRKGDPVRENGIQILRENYADIGVRLQPRVMEFATAVDMVRHGDFQAYLGVFSARLAIDPSALLASDAFDRFNYGHYASAAADSMMDLAMKTEDREAARRIWSDFQRFMAWDQPMAFIYYPQSIVAYNRRLQDVRPHVLSPYTNIGEWWIDAADRKYDD